MNKTTEKNCQLFLDYLISLKEDPVVMSVRTMDVRFKLKDALYSPILGTKLKVLSELEKLKAIKYKRTGKFKFKTEIIILKEKI